jgi:signal transduction histidine kinase
VRVLGARRDAAIEGIRTRRRLVATMFHDLANPLMVVALEVEMLDGGPEDDERLASAHAMVRRMQATLESALSGRVVTTDVEVGRLADELAVLFRDRLRRKALSFDVNGPRLVRLRADEALLRDSVLANLVSNALKFSDAGSTIDFTIRPEPGRVILMLEDRGPGLPDDVATALQAGRGVPSRRGSHGETGSGNGLLLAHDYVAAMGGRLELLPRAGGGLSAIVTLPAA